ncbi:hypothetical protein SSPO_045880 [Streptomyces antimycoticus]|uniref:Uncharacterized protein n=1 Tax=Streptomyces antimycoticus TaxID=68175 RepID=A0A499UMZ2_9ACTN|nr:hypothetical protein SSPO_045880 [Streptomyces antimycoticus]
MTEAAPGTSRQAAVSKGETLSDQAAGNEESQDRGQGVQA